MALELGTNSVSLEKTPDGRRLVVRHDVAASVDTVWDILTDTECWADWGPSVTAVETTTRHIDVGTTGRVRAAGVVWLPFEVTACTPYRWTWNVARLPATGHFAEERADGAVVGFEIPPLATGYAPVCARACQRIAAMAQRRET
ncbi:SRPBCC family protein [Haloarcula sp. CBA1130]|uniref:SRPBCC family protein n=1 Tax=unclassified Haloarcula TaxID=2624677 RepID=UPI0012463A89|nr:MULTISPECIES: SRPBCC family protein [unclassified Haloarcula]KAA9397071.1 SRPBCC family protein [Haloarcula sp. CBA1129]KAA9402890.1 SRPBCC family protein [Haloarcula sp. CBA1130]